MRGVWKIVVVAGLGACAHAVGPVPSDWRQVSMRSTEVPLAITDPQALDDTLRGLVKPPSVCFRDPAACGVTAAPMSLSALRPDEAALDALQSAFEKHVDAWPVESRWFHCESLAAWRPVAGRACVEKLTQGDALLDDKTRLRALPLLDVLGAEGEALARTWLRHENVGVRRDLATWWNGRAITDEMVVPLLEALVAEPDVQTAVQLVRAFSVLRDPRALPVLDRMARGEKQLAVRTAAIDTLTDLAGLPIRARLLTIKVDQPGVEEAIVRNLYRLNDVADGSSDPFKLTGSFDFLATNPEPQVGGLAFMEAFKSRHQRMYQWAKGEQLTREELDELFRRLEDAGGFGLLPVRSSMAMSMSLQDLPRLAALRQAAFAAGLPDRDAMVKDLAEVARVVREHYAMNRATRYWRRASPVVFQEPLRFHP